MSNRFEMLIDSKFIGLTKVTKDGKPVEYQDGNRNIWNDLNGLLEITPPEGEDIRFCSIKVQTKIKANVECAVEEGKWKIRFPHSKSNGADSPTTVNVTVAPPEGNGP
ncbi:MAG TPA: hypothetical protein VK469_21735 [Candidatus Kapabacteria bacterium]|nr:hypothetical protein [Candidatus Kapabacteria bacterium]